MIRSCDPLARFAGDLDPLLHSIPLLKEAVTAMPEDDPQHREDEHVTDVKQRRETADQDGR